MPKIDAGAQDLERVRKILRKHVPTRNVVAFGSRVTGRTKPFSDLDLAILGDTATSSAILAALADDFDESSLPFRVDVVDWATTNQAFRDIIARDAVTLQEGLRPGDESCP